MADVKISVIDSTLHITLHRPSKRNAITSDMWHRIIEGVAEAERSPTVRSLIVSGAGGCFSAGGDLASVKDADGTENVAYRRLAMTGLGAIRDVSVPTIAAIEGVCIGGGCNVALACDIRVAAPSAVFAIPAVRHGLLYDEPTVSRLVELVGSGQTHHLLLTGRRISARDALRVGLVDLCSSDPLAEARQLAAGIAEGDPSTVAATRAMIRRISKARA